MENNIKRNYETPAAEKMEFNYCDQVVAASQAQSCVSVWINQGGDSCESGNAFLKPLN